LRSFGVTQLRKIGLFLPLDDIRHSAFVAERILLQPKAGGTQLRIGQLRVAGREFTTCALIAANSTGLAAIYVAVAGR
jgi:hypothetical protein